MSTIAKRVDKVETAMKARASDLSLLSDEELIRRMTEIAQRLVANKAETIEELTAMAPGELARLSSLIDSLSSSLADFFNFDEIREILSTACSIQSAASGVKPH
jgi:galactokinase